MFYRTEDLHLKWTKVVLPPVFLEEELPATERANATVFNARAEIADILAGKDRRLMVVVGPEGCARICHAAEGCDRRILARTVHRDARLF
jgi:phospho-2-dehydro-3-deoxyheptonate aldolase